MASNNETLFEIYQDISILEILEKIQSCGLTWQYVKPNHYRVSVLAFDGVLWELNITKDAKSDIHLDFTKNGSFQSALSSDQQSHLVDLYNDIEGDADFVKDQELMQYLSALPGCEPS